MRRYDRFSPRQPPQAGAAFAEAPSGIGNLPIAIPDSADPAARSAPKSKRGGGRKPGQPVALSAFLEVSPAIRSHESPAAAVSAAVIRPSQKPHVSLNPLSVRLPLTATQKAPQIVQKLWTSELPCGSQRKSKIKSLAGRDLAQVFQSLARGQRNGRR